MEITNEYDSIQIKEYSPKEYTLSEKQCRNCENVIMNQINGLIEENMSRLGLTPPDEVYFFYNMRVN